MFGVISGVTSTPIARSLHGNSCDDLLKPLDIQPVSNSVSTTSKLSFPTSSRPFISNLGMPRDRHISVE